jgi:hypothetical protein
MAGHLMEARRTAANPTAAIAKTRLNLYGKQTRNGWQQPLLAVFFCAHD